MPAVMEVLGTSTTLIPNCKVLCLPLFDAPPTPTALQIKELISGTYHISLFSKELFLYLVLVLYLR